MNADLPTSAESGEAAPDPLAEGNALLVSLREVAGGAVDLLGAELRRAGLSLSLMLGLAVALGTLVVSAWLLVCATLVAAASAAGHSLAVSLLAVAVANLLCALGCWQLIRVLARNLGFTASRRMLNTEPEANDADAPAPA